MGKTEERIHSLRWLILIVVSTAAMTAGLQNTITNVALPTLQQVFDASSTQLQWFVNSYILVYAGFLLLMGAIADKYGRKRWLNIGLIIFGLSSLAAAYMAAINTFVTTQIIMGFGAAILTPATLAIVINVFPKEDRARAIAIWTGLTVLGVGLGPLIGGILLENFWYGSVYLINIPIILAVLIIGYFIIPESKNENAPQIDVRGGVLSFLSISFVIVTIVAGPILGWLNLWVIISAVVSGILVYLFIRQEQETKYPLLPLHYFENIGFTGGAISVAMVMFALFTVIFFLTQFLQIVQERSAFEAGLLTLPLAFALAIAAGAAPHIVKRRGVRTVTFTGLVILAISMVIQGLWPIDASNGFIIITTLIMGIGAGLVVSPGTVGIMEAVPDERAGTGSGVSAVTKQIGGSIGIALLSSIQTANYSDLITEEFPGAPSQTLEVVTGSLAGAHEVAALVGGEAEEILIEIANAAFVESMGIALLVGAILVLVAALAVFRMMKNYTNA